VQQPAFVAPVVDRRFEVSEERRGVLNFIDDDGRWMAIEELAARRLCLLRNPG